MIYRIKRFFWKKLSIEISNLEDENEKLDKENILLIRKLNLQTSIDDYKDDLIKTLRNLIDAKDVYIDYQNGRLIDYKNQ